MNFCPNCSQELKEGIKFCPKCGCNLAEMSVTSNEETMTTKLKTQFEKIKADEPYTLELEKVKGMNVTREELKKDAQRKLSGRYGEWFKSIIWMLVATLVATFIMFYSFTRMGSASIGRTYNYYGNYERPFSSLSIFFWFIVMLVSLVVLLLIACLTNAVMQWCAIYTLKDQRADGVRIFDYFIKAEKNRVLKANILTTVYTFLWSLLFIIPGVVKSVSYTMTNYLLEKEPELSASEAIKLSRQIMHGYKLEFLILRYSFYLWQLVNSFSFGLSNFYVLPYQNVTEMKFLDILYETKRND